MSEQESEEQEPLEDEVEPEVRNLRDHRDYKKLEREIAKFFKRDTTKGGRPTVGEVKFRDFYYEFANFKFFDEFQKKQKQEVNPEAGDSDNKNGRGIFSEFFGQSDLGKFFGKSGDKAIDNAIQRFGPYIMLIASEYMAEKAFKDKGWPQIIHTLIDILNMFFMLISMLTKFIGSLANINPEQIVQDEISKIQRRASPEGVVDKAEFIGQKIQEGDILALAVEAFKLSFLGPIGSQLF